MRKRRRKKTAHLPKQILILVMLALVVPASINGLRYLGPLLGETGERVAMIAAAVNMPEEGLDMLRDRFQDDLYLEHLPDSQPAPEQSQIPFAHPTNPQEQEPEQAPSAKTSPPTAASPNIPMAYRAAIISENFASTNSVMLVQHGAGSIKNESKLTNDEVAEILETPMGIVFENTGEPQVLIVHTHATEAFERYDSAYYDTRNNWRSLDNNENMVAVGKAMAQVLEENGIGVVHDATQHDYPSYNGSYERSAQTIQSYLDEYPSIKVVLDLHRDAMQRENDAIIKPVTSIDSKKAAQIMIIAAADDTGELGVPNYRENLRFAAAFQSYMASEYEDLTRPVYFAYRKYNMDLTTGSLLLEFGSNANTLEEAVYSATLAGEALAELIYDYME